MQCLRPEVCKVIPHLTYFLAGRDALIVRALRGYVDIKMPFANATECSGCRVAVKQGSTTSSFVLSGRREAELLNCVVFT